MRLVFLLVLGLGACVTVGPEGRFLKASKSPWVEPSPQLAMRIDEQAERLPYTHGQGRLEQIHWFASIGEPAYSKLLVLVQDPRPDVAGSALAALGATRDSRLVEHLRAQPLRPETPQWLRYEWARTYLRLGDWSAVPVLIRALAADEMMVRALGSQALFEATGQRFGFEPKGEPEERAAAITRWEEWWQSRQVEGVLLTSNL
jgi:hypothetical protein